MIHLSLSNFIFFSNMNNFNASFLELWTRLYLQRKFYAQALDLIGPIYRTMDSFVGVREKTCILFAYGLLLMKQHDLQEARSNLGVIEFFSLSRTSFLLTGIVIAT